MRFFQDCFKRRKKFQNKSLHKTSTEVIEVWKNANVPTIRISSISSRINLKYKRWCLLSKNKKRRNNSQINKEKSFTKDFYNLFDVCHLSNILDSNARELLMDQRNERLMRITSSIQPRNFKEKGKLYFISFKNIEEKKCLHVIKFLYISR